MFYCVISNESIVLTDTLFHERSNKKFQLNKKAIVILHIPSEAG